MEMVYVVGGRPIPRVLCEQVRRDSWIVGVVEERFGHGCRYQFLPCVPRGLDTVLEVVEIVFLES
jgi:hypothetical protein